MILKELQISAFMGLRDRTFSLSPGVNLFEGENESGKSSIAAFLKYLFYGFSKGGRGELPEKIKTMPFGGGGIGGSLLLEEDGREYRVERRSEPLAGGGVREEWQIVDLQSGEIRREEPGEFFFGLSEALFVRSIFHAGGELSVSGAAMEEAIENLLLSADEELCVRKAMKRLDEARTLLLHKNGKGGRIASLRGEEEALEERLAASEEAGKQIRALSESCDALREKIREDRELLSLCERRMAFTDAAVRLGLLRRMRRAGEALRAAREEEEAFLAARRFGEFFPTSDYEALLVKKEGEYFDWQKTRIEEAKKQKEAEKAVMEGPEKDSAAGEALLWETGRLRGRAALLAAAGGGLLAVGVGALLFLWRRRPADLFAPYGGIAGGLLLLGALSLLGSALLFRRRRRKFHAWGQGIRGEEDLRAAIEDLREREKTRLRARTAAEMQTAALHAAEEKERRTLRELDALASKWGRRCESAEEIPALLSDVREALAGAEALRARVRQAEAVNRAEEAQSGGFAKALSESEETEEEARLSSLLSELPKGGNGEEGGKWEPLDGAAYGENRKKSVFYKQAVAALEEKLREGEKRLIELQAGMEDPEELRRALEEAKRERERLRLFHDAYLLAYEKLEEASIRLREKTLPLLGKEASAFFSAATEGRYEALLVDKGLEPKFLLQGETRENGYFSSGTRILAYLGLRLAVLKLLFRGKRPPLLFDESFACLDDERLSAALRGLGALLEDGRVEQILLFTSQKRERALCGALFGERVHILPLSRLPRPLSHETEGEKTLSQGWGFAPTPT